MARLWPDGFDDRAAASVFAEHLGAVTDDHLLECTTEDRNRIFNLGYFTWVEQQGVALSDFEARRDQAFWAGLVDLAPKWDAAIDEFNDRTGVLALGETRVVISCAGCGWPAPPGSDTPFRCPRAGRPRDDTDHVLVRRLPPGAEWPSGEEAEPVPPLSHPPRRPRASGQRCGLRRHRRAARRHGRGRRRRRFLHHAVPTTTTRSMRG